MYFTAMKHRVGVQMWLYDTMRERQCGKIVLLWRDSVVVA